MQQDRINFFQLNIEPLEEFLLEQPLGQLFTGKIYEADDQLFTGLNLDGFGNERISLDASTTARLFMVPDESLIDVTRVREKANGAPAGVQVESDNAFVQEGEPVAIIAYQDQGGNAVRILNLHILRVMLEANAPQRFCTVAFGLMVVTAYQLGFSRVTLFAAGRAPLGEDDSDEMVGFIVWPKFGFDAKVNPAELNSHAALKNCDTVQDVLGIDPAWWANVGGSAREMEFDLNPDSRSWSILLDYIYGALT